MEQNSAHLCMADPSSPLNVEKLAFIIYGATETNYRLQYQRGFPEATVELITAMFQMETKQRCFTSHRRLTADLIFSNTAV